MILPENGTYDLLRDFHQTKLQLKDDLPHKAKQNLHRLVSLKNCYLSLNFICNS